MEIFIDADGCPVVDLTVNIAEQYNIKTTIVCDTSHIFDYESVKVITVSKGVDSADFALVNKAKKGDIVITQDYGLAAMCVARNMIPINQNGFIYTNENIDNMLMRRHMAKKIRKAGGKTTNMKKRSSDDDKKFTECLLNVIEKELATANIES